MKIKVIVATHKPEGFLSLRIMEKTVLKWTGLQGGIEYFDRTPLDASPQTIQGLLTKKLAELRSDEVAFCVLETNYPGSKETYVWEGFDFAAYAGKAFFAFFDATAAMGEKAGVQQALANENVFRFGTNGQINIPDLTSAHQKLHAQYLKRNGHE